MSYKQQILIGFVLLISFIEAAVISYDIHTAYQIRQDFLQTRSHMISQTYTQALRVPVWNLDNETIIHLLKSVLLDQDVIHIELIFNESSLAPIRLDKGVNTNDIDKFTISHDVFEPDSSNKTALLKIDFSNQQLSNFLSERIKNGLIELALLLLINILIARSLLNRITSPLLKLSHSIVQLSNNNLDIKIPETERKDEIGNVARSIEGFRQNSLELEELRASMENKIIEQTKDLVVAKEKAESATIAKSQFLATMSHEIRTPLNGVLGMAQILKETSLSQEQQESVNIILSSGQHLISIINEILDFSKLDANQLKLEFISFNLKKLTQELFLLLQPSANDKNLEFQLNYEATAPTYFIGDPVRVKQIILNLLNNAIKFTTHGQVKLSIHHLTQKNGVSQLEIKVSDTGIGITEQQKSKLFESFTQADQDTTRKYGGTGLGLSICKKLVELMSGTINVSSVSGKGSVFSVKLPLAIDLKKNQLDKKIAITASETALSHSPGLALFPGNPLLNHTLLLVEDNFVNQKIALTMLKKLGLNFDLAKDGQQAVELWQQNHYPFIYMDCLMPLMDGYQACQQIRQLQQAEGENFHPVTIVALTANASASDSEKCLTSGMDDIVIKPFNKNDLINNLNKWGKQLLA